MDDASVQAKREAFAAYRDEPVLYRGHPVRRGFALLIEGELSQDDIEELIAIGDLQSLKCIPAMPDDEARIAVMADVIDANRQQASFEFPYKSPNF